MKILQHFLNWGVDVRLPGIVEGGTFEFNDDDRKYKIKGGIALDSDISYISAKEEQEATEYQIVDLIYNKFFKCSFYEKFMKGLFEAKPIVFEKYGIEEPLKGYFNNDKYMIICNRGTAFKMTYKNDLVIKNLLSDDNIQRDFVVVLDIEKTKIKVNVPTAPDRELEYHFFDNETNRLVDFRMDSVYGDSKIVRLSKEEEVTKAQATTEMWTYLHTLRSNWYRGLR